MAREHQKTRSIKLEAHADVWASLELVEKLLAARVAQETSDTQGWAMVTDEGGTFETPTLAEARAEFSESRHALKSISLVWRTSSPTFPLTRDRFIHVIADGLDRFGTSVAALEPVMRLSVHSGDESEALGLSQAMLEVVEHAQARSRPAPPAPVAAVTRAPTPMWSPPPAADPPVTVELKQAAVAKPWWKSSTVWHNPYLVTLLTGLILLAVGIWASQHFS